MRRRVLLGGVGMLLAVAFIVGGVLVARRDRSESEARTNPAPAATKSVFSTLDVPKPVPALRFADAAGRPLSLTNFRGKAVLLNLWATWCVPCREEMPALDRLQAQLGGSYFEVLALSIDRKGLPAVKAFYDQLGLKSLAIYVDDTASAARDVGAPGIPTTLLIDADGHELGRALGAKPWDAPEVAAEIEHRLGRALRSTAAEARP